MHPTHRFLILALIASPVGIGLSPTLVQAQLPSASAAALGTANNYTALARGYAAVAWNPANLGLSDNPYFSLSVGPVRAGFGSDPVGLGDIADYEGRVVPASQKLSWMQKIEDAGGQAGGVDAQVSALAFNLGRFGFQVATVGDVEARLNPDGAELILFGNTGRTGTARDLELGDSRLDGFAATTFALGYAIPLNLELGLPGARFAVGATVKVTVGHALLLGRNSGSSVSSDPLAIDMRFPVITPGSDTGFNNGTGISLDVGAVWQARQWTVGATIQNLIQTFQWDLKNHTFRRGEAFFNKDESDSDFDERPLAEAPSFLLDEIRKRNFDPRLSAGAAYRVSDHLTLTGDLRHRLGEGLHLGEKTHLGSGVEYRPIAQVPLRAGLAVVTGGFQLAAGAGVVLGPVHLSGAVLTRTGDDDRTVYMAALSFLGS